MSKGKNLFYISIADRIIEIHSLYEDCISRCSDYVLNNVDGNTKPDIIIDVVPRDIMRENDAYQKNDQGLYLYYNPGYLENFAIQRKISEIMPDFDTFLMHGAVVGCNGCAYMFTAPSGVGKSTRIKLWLQAFPDSFVINGDKPFIKVTDDCIIAYGSPWCGKEHWNKNVGIPLQAIFILERAEDEDDSIEEVTMSDVYSDLVKQVYQPHNTQHMLKTIQLLNRMEGKVRFFRFRSNPTIEGVQLAYEAAKPDVQS